MITRCNNGHWYDSSVNRTCPHCKQESEKLSIRLDDVEEDDHTISFAEAELSLGEELGAIIGKSVDGNLKGEQTAQTGEDEDKTVSFGFFGLSMKQQPVTGWLVCMNGNEKGKDYRLHTGKNFVGRSTSMDVVLVEDKSIARDKHCTITYDPKGNSFYVSAEGGNIVRVNGGLVETPVKLQRNDEIIIGETKLVFIPFCEEERIWERD